jgi:hypothetical protein
MNPKSWITSTCEQAMQHWISSQWVGFSFRINDTHNKLVIRMRLNGRTRETRKGFSGRLDGERTSSNFDERALCRGQREWPFTP